VILFSFRKQRIYYVSFNIYGSQIAATIPPFGIFIEEKYKGNKEILRHELVHWQQYQRMGFSTFYLTYFSEYFKYGRINGPMEVEARRLSKKQFILCD
jgi:hypothetical protein